MDKAKNYFRRHLKDVGQREKNFHDSSAIISVKINYDRISLLVKVPFLSRVEYLQHYFLRLNEDDDVFYYLNFLESLAGLYCFQVKKMYHIGLFFALLAKEVYGTFRQQRLLIKFSAHYFLKSYIFHSKDEKELHYMFQRPVITQNSKGNLFVSFYQDKME